MIVLIAVLIVGLLVWGFWPQPVLVEAIAATRAPLTVTIEEEGRTRVIDRYVISAPVDGVACRVQLDVGDPVEQGSGAAEPITPLESQVLDPRNRAKAEAHVAAAKSTLRAAEEQARAATAAEQLAATELRRKRPLMDKALISSDVYDKAVAEAKTTTAVRRSAEFTVKVAKHELQAARTVLDYTAGTTQGPAERVPVRSPIAG